MPASLAICQPGFLKRLAAASKHAGKYPIDRILQDLRNGLDLCDLAKQHHLLPDTSEEAHLRRDWYGGAASWWPNWDVGRIVRDGYIELLTAVQQTRLPVVAHWIEGAVEFRTACLVSDDQITFLLLTPPRTRREGDDDYEDWDK